jgi:hypothetical protein
MSDLSSYERDDPDFVRDLMASNPHVEKVAAWLRSKGHEAVVRPIQVRDKVENMSKFADDGDIYIGDRRVEVKRRGLRFTCADDFPYPTVIVDVAHAWDRADPKPEAYILTNEAATHCMIIRDQTSMHWRRVTKMDRFKKRERTFLECPIEHALFRTISASESPSG